VGALRSPTGLCEHAGYPLHQRHSCHRHHRLDRDSTHLEHPNLFRINDLARRQVPVQPFDHQIFGVHAQHPSVDLGLGRNADSKHEESHGQERQSVNWTSAAVDP